MDHNISNTGITNILDRLEDFNKQNKLLFATANQVVNSMTPSSSGAF